MRRSRRRQKAANLRPNITLVTVTKWASEALKTGEKMYMQLRGAKFQPTGENSIAGGLVFTVKSKEWVTVAPKEYAKTTAAWPKPKWGV